MEGFDTAFLRSTRTGRVLSAFGMGNTFGRTVAICGRASGQRMVAKRLPPNAGRVCKSSPVSLSISSCVQSAVSPVESRAATRGARLRPNIVPPSRKMSGENSRASAQISSV